MALSNFVYSLFLFSFVYSISIPPSILEEPDSDIIFDSRLNLQLACLAKGEPTPTYTWTKNGYLYETNEQNNRVTMANDSGMLTFIQPQSIDQGWYQCNATNIWGTAVSRRVHVRIAELGEFPIYDRAQVIQVRRGDSLRIPCKPPISVPDPEIYWTDNTNSDNQIGFRVASSRIQQDYDGNLYLINVKDEDEEKQFTCNVFSGKLDVIRRGSVTKLKVIKTEPIERKPTKLWSSEANKVFLKGQKLSLKCVFDGLPTPDVIWRKDNGGLPEQRSNINREKQELIITDLQYEDAGVYECRGHNELGYDGFAINVQVEAAPYWLEKPKDAYLVEGETVDVICNAESKPASKNTQWLINGVPLQDINVPYNPRRRIMRNRMIIQNVTKFDTAVYQCNISNVHGYVFANFFINIISEKPTIKRGPETFYHLVEGQNIILPCETIGASSSKIYWNKRNRIITSARYSISKDGSLTIPAAVLSDSGVYVCNATNKFGFDTRNTTLTVKQKTRIQTGPSNQQVRRGYQAIFRCTATVDPSLTYNIDWYKDGELLTYAGRFIKDIADQNTLKIVDVQFDDSGSYVCRASTELDFDDASATLIVQDRPNRPKITKVICNGSSDQPFSIVQWRGTGDNNARILYYELQYNTTFQPNDWISIPIEQRKESFSEIKLPDGSIKLEPKAISNELNIEEKKPIPYCFCLAFNTTHIPSSQNDLRVSLSCWANYTFRVIAYNRIGASEASPTSEPLCTTKTCRPKTNPEGIKSSTAQSALLLIEWESMPKIKWSSPDFWYEVGWRQYALDNSSEPFSTEIIYPPNYQFTIPNTMTDMRYQYYVKAVNQQTGANNSTDAIEPPVYNIAFAGDSAPTYVPRNFRVLQMLDSTTVQFAWDPPLSSDEINIRGALKAYQIEIFRLDNPVKSRLLISDILPNQTSSTVFNAPPNADVGAHIRIETERYLGPTSPVIQFPTREGRPEPVTNLRGVPYTSNGIFLLWDPPDETNGVIIGYQIDYKPIESIAAQPGVDQPSILLRDDARRNYLLSGLKPNTKYRVQVRPRTSIGLSTSPAIIELTTNLTLAPSKPTFTVTQRGQTFFNVSFDPTIMTIPGSVYYVQYKENDQDDQTTTFKESYNVSNDRTILVNSLEPGKTYTTILVAGDGILSETKSDPQMVSTRKKDRAPRVIESPWFIGIIISVIVLIIVFAIVCGIMRRKGGKYSVQDKEMLHGPSGYGDSDGKFSEYYRAPSDASMKHSRTSLQNGDDRDSMAEFNDEKDRSRFTEDGSFIGQYGRDDKRHTYLVKYDESDGFPN
ncbi:unnamed protein product [Rotaria socialis]|uniref:Uncharacterized protein n=1 Tax=Rotaria socialis TaxID=392032 RepID=A0A820FEM7_9BILA|nr:unnamed protein product [Rotaria socialis]CAF4263440.1 unnamed protein product [Rotaria socialis]CAF4290934.1 unnamed protein product [Rotaria socialis]